MISRNEYIDAEILFAMIEEELHRGRKASFVVTGMSMWPFICHGRDSVVVEAVPPDKNEKALLRGLKVGDIVLLKMAGGKKYILHRITHVQKGSNQIQTTGDGNCYRDGWFPAEAVVARVTEIEYKGKLISVDSCAQRTLSFIWRRLYPVRPFMLKVLRGISRRHNRSKKR